MLKIKIRKRTVFIFLTLIGLLAYFNSFGVPFHYDDISFLREKTVIKSSALFSQWIKEDYSRIIIGRAFLLFTFYLNYIIGGLDVFGYHLVNLLIHISTAFLFYLLIAKYVDRDVIARSGSDEAISFKDEIATPSARNDKSIAPILAASLFLLHPINTESVTYISSRSSVLSAFFILASMLAFFRATFYRHPINSSLSPSPQSPPLKGGGIREETPFEGGETKGETPNVSSPLVGEGKGEGRFTGRKFHAGYYALSIISFLLGLSTKESAIVMPALILLFDIYFISDKGKNFKSRLKYHLPFWLIILGGSFYYLGYITRPAMYDRPWSAHIFTELKVFVEYLKLLILPLNLNIDHHIRASMTFDPSVIVSMVVISGLLLSAIFLKSRNKVLSFSILWFFLNLAPFLLIRLEDYMAERWVYAASLGFSLGISELLTALYLRHKRIGMPAIAFVLIFLGVLTYMRNNAYGDPVTLWADAARKSPEKARPYINLCASYVEKKEVDKAIEICSAAIEKGSRHSETYINLATAYFYKDDLDNAEKIYLLMPKVKGIRVNKEAIEAYHYNFASVYKRKKEYNKAIGEYEKVLKIKPQSPAPLALIGECYVQLNMKNKADEYFRLATNGIPRNGDDYFMLAKSFFQLGEAQKGFESLRNAITTEPLNTNIRYFVATTYLEIENYDLAFKHYSIITKLSPQYTPAYTGMGKAMLATGNLREASKHFNKALSLLPPGFESQRPGSPERKELLELLDKTKG